jgi:phospholipid/cholesterol/gamma-HCH transport system substrate-binding protein
MRRVHPGISALRAGLIAIALISVTTYFVFTKSVPLRHHYEIRAVVQNTNLLKPRSPVRIAGVNVGQIASVGRYKHTDLGLITMRIDAQGRPVHSDATLKIRPRLFLEGNFYVDLKPGTPGAPELRDRGLIPLTHTARAVQLDQVLSALSSDTRHSLQQAVQGFGAALGGAPTAADDAAHDPAVRGLTGGQALNQSLRSSPQALRDSAIVADALRGTRAHDLSRTVAGFARAGSTLADNEADLAALVGHFDQTMSALASQAPALARTVSLLGPTATNAKAGFAALGAAIPATRRFARDLAPSVAQTPATITAADPWLAQAKPLLSRPELGGLLHQLRPATGQLARLGHATRQFLPRIDAFNRCVTNVILPTGNINVDDGPFSAGVENYKEFWTAMTGQAGEVQGFDGNGPYLRLSAAGGGSTLRTGQTNYSHSSLFANPSLPPLRTRPAYPNKLVPLRRDIPCATQPVPDVNGPASSGPADGSDPNAPAPPVVDEPGVKLAAFARAALATLKGALR